MATSPICAHCGEPNEAKRSNCELCGLSLNDSAAGFLNNIDDELRSMLAGSSSSQLLTMQPVRVQTAHNPHDWSAPPQLKMAEPQPSTLNKPLMGSGLFAIGAFLWFGQTFGFCPTFPLLSYLTMAIGAAFWRTGSDR